MAVGVVSYMTAMVAANLSVAAFGPRVSPLNSLVLIGLDLSLRDWLHIGLSRWQMGAMILITGVISYFLNPSSSHIALASTVAFMAAAMADWVVFTRLSTRSWMVKTNGSNVAGAVVDSIIFPTLAFNRFLPGIVTLQIIAKIVGGAAWAWVLRRR